MRNRITIGSLRLGAVVATGALVAVSAVTARAAQQSAVPPSGGTTAVAAAQRGASAPSIPVVSGDKLPANAVPYHGALPKTGATGPAFPATTGGGSSVPRIVGGSPAQSSDFPYVVGIETFFVAIDPTTNQPTEFEATCTGTTLSNYAVLTAGHCDTDMPFGTTFVIAGRNTLSDTTSGFVDRVQSSWTDQSFNLAALNSGATTVPVHDVAVLKLVTALPVAYVPPLRYAPQGDPTQLAGLSATIAGYGETTAGDVSTVGTLFAATVPIQSDATCAADPALAGYDPSTMTCAGVPAPTGGIDACNGDSGGPLLINDLGTPVEVGITDWGGQTCGTDYGVYERLSAYNTEVLSADEIPSTVNLDFFGGGHSGLMALNGSGNLVYYAGSGFLNDGFNGFAGTAQVGSGFGGFKKIFRVTNWNNDNAESVMAVATNGNLYEWTTDGAGNWTNGGNAILIGTGWNMFSDIMVVNNWTSDGHADLLGRTPSGDLYFYESDGSGGWLNNGIGQLIGTGWNMFNTVLTPGEWTGHGFQALIGRTPAGGLYLYESNDQGGWMNNGIGIKIGTGWNIFSTFMAPGDWNGDGLIDMIGITSGGVLDMYETDGHGNWLNNGRGTQIGTGWNIFKAVF